jgi:shikimate dehydrogenase
MLGSGGAARAIAFNLARKTKPGELTILDINDILLRELGADLKADTDTCIDTGLMNAESLAAAMEKADVIIHCTPVGMHPHTEASLIPIDLLRPGQVVFDIVYTPLKTKLISEAESRGLQVISGVDMFINQAVLQFEHFTRTRAPVEVMRRVVMEHLGS